MVTKTYYQLLQVSTNTWYLFFGFDFSLVVVVDDIVVSGDHQSAFYRVVEHNCCLHCFSG